MPRTTKILKLYLYSAAACLAAVLTWELERSVFSPIVIALLLLRIWTVVLLVGLPFALPRFSNEQLHLSRKLLWICAACLVGFLCWTSYLHGRIDAQLEQKRYAGESYES